MKLEKEGLELHIDAEKIIETTILNSKEEVIQIAPSSLLEIVEKWVYTDRKIHLSTIVGIDNETDITLIYYFMNHDDFKTLVLKTVLPYDNLEIDSISLLTGSAVYEGEIAEMFGVKFNGNPMNKVFLPDGWEGEYPMRKSWKNKEGK
jgi:NADH:ubiquinone oxidoreductase subunit C